MLGSSISCLLFALIVGSSERYYSIHRLLYELEGIKADLLEIDKKEDVYKIVEKIDVLLREEKENND